MSISNAGPSTPLKNASLRMTAFIYMRWILEDEGADAFSEYLLAV
jgi:hypothetical protein